MKKIPGVTACSLSGVFCFRSFGGNVYRLLFFGSAVFFIISPRFCNAQEGPTPRRVTVEVERKNDTMLKGKLLGIAKDTVRLIDADNQEWRIAMKDIRNIEYIDSLRVRNKWFDSPNTSRYLFTATGLPLKKKEIVLQSTYLFLVSAHYGISNRVSIGGGTEVLSNSTYFLHAKVNLINDANYKFSAGASYYRLPKDFITTVYNEEIRNIGMLTAASTWGNPNHHLTLGAGYIFTEGALTPPLVTLSGTTRLGKHIALVTENWFLFVGEKNVELPVLLSLGLRYIG
jgi:hypothetical protein